jgi:hypothetical protein
MKRLLQLLLAFSIAAPVASAQPPEPPKNPGKPTEFFVARRQALAARKVAAKERMRQFKAARAAEQEKLYQDWHERYLADAPVREQYYRTQESAYQTETALAQQRTAYFYAAGPPVILPVFPPYTPSCSINRCSFYTTNYGGW